VTFEGHFGDLLTVVTLCAQLTRGLLAIAKFLVLFRLRTFEIEKKSSLCKAGLTRLEPDHHFTGIDRQRLFTERSAVAKVDPTVDQVAVRRQSAARSRAAVERRDLQVLVAESGPLYVEFEVVQDDPDGLSALNGKAPAAVGVEKVLAGVVGTGDVSVVVEYDRTTPVFSCLRRRR